ncbi:MAG: biliverdin-producing heme oxygenase [Burkholderiaceae bacterium]
MTLAARLKSATAHAHRRLETAVDIMRPDLTLEHYMASLDRFHGFISPWENAMRAAMPAPLAGLFAARFKSEWLERDIAFLRGGAAPMPAACADLPALSSVARMLGSAYVVEGSSLGAKFIASHVAGRLGLDADGGCRYFTGYGTETGRMWNAFLERMTSAAPPAEHDEVIDAAAQTFDCLHRWFAPEAVEAGHG